MRLGSGVITSRPAQATVRSKLKVPHSTRRGLVTDASAGTSDPHAYCRQFVRKHDYDSFLTSYFYPREVQSGYFAIKAFSVELATVQDNVSSAMIGKMRMQFWRDAVKGLSEGRPPKHPIALALHETSQRSKLSAYHLKRIIDARDAELHTPSHFTIDSLTSHAESTSSTVLYLLLSLLSLSSSNLSHAASHLGTAQTITTLLRALPYHAKQGRMVIPADITAKHGVKQEEVFRQGPQAQGIEDAAFEFATIAHDHLNTARDMLMKSEGSNGRVPREAMPIFLAGVPVSNYLKRLEKAGFDPFDPKLQRRDGLVALQIWKSYFTNQF
ncbi:isoprenoid synthase domain-containing protein [Crassisporium funariophilum]|nr:isoprenoid synthase domain-containing protein [Crassisporium funariophilum]